MPKVTRYLVVKVDINMIDGNIDENDESKMQKVVDTVVEEVYCTLLFDQRVSFSDRSFVNASISTSEVLGLLKDNPIED
jgi:hypothetical protein